jgi:hypothetical protein
MPNVPIIPHVTTPKPLLACPSETSWDKRGKFGVKMIQQAVEKRDKITGGCQCGRVRYAFAGSMGEAIICHCRMCQKAFGNWGAALIALPFENFQWTRAEPAIFRSSAIVSRGFCKDCGTPLFMREDGDSTIEIAIGSLDQPSAIPPLRLQSAVEHRVAWFTTMHLLPEETLQNSRTPADLAKLKSFQHPDAET